ncbi:MAG: peptidoglycan DD-metalloendopeptidase family protein [Pseudomonadota bacterium]|nr:peptidoglycan DD-metalloendopeptidase family protein [Pseudomonadota bacterium]
MKWIVTFLAGLLLGAAGLFVYLRQIPHAAAPAVVVAPPALLPPAAGPNPVTAALPGAPVVPTDLTEADLPLRPTPQEMPIAATPPDVAAGKLLIPVEGVKLAQLSDNFNAPRGKDRRHEALDIMAPKGTRVIAVADGKVVKLFNSKPGGLTVYQFDPTGKYAYYYAHLDRYADGIKEGDVLKRGDLVGYVGSTGDASPSAPHLHFAVVELTPAKEWWKGTAVNPFPLMGD